jgi:L-lactate dehydrogenase complex protein LldE
MKVALFIPCYVDQLYPDIGIATYNVLTKFGVSVVYPENQTCCGQPMANSGCEHLALPTYQHFESVFNGYDYIVAPSSSCVYHVSKHYDLLPQTESVRHMRTSIYELTDFLINVLGVERVGGSFEKRVGLHLSCHGQRGLGNATRSEITDLKDGNIRQLLNGIEGLTLTDLDRYDECCGFGGTFCVTEEAVSSRMGVDRIADHTKHDAEIITGGDMSCLMHLEGLLRRRKSSLQVMHIAELLDAVKV